MSRRILALALPSGLALLLTLVLAPALPDWGVFAQGHGYTPQDIENGGQIYQANCTACHGPEGDGVPGTDLGRGTFRRATADEELVRIILGGIPGTAMPPSNFSEGQAGTIVAYLRSLATSPRGTTIPGDAARGRSIVEGTGTKDGQCLTCHSIAGTGARTGPPLTEIGAQRRAIELHRSLVDPSAQIRSDSQTVRAVTRQGTTITGRLLNQDSFSLQLLDSSERLVLLEKSSLREYSILKESPMPSYADRLTTQELADVVSYLTTLRGKR
jgi:putative heme-binding domain-containing protein